MDAQLKRGVIEACLLKLLTQGDSYGYQLSKDASELIPLSESTLYPVLKRLEASGAVDSYRQEHQGRLRKYYRITPRGLEDIRAFLVQWEQLSRVYTFIRGDKA